MQATKDHMERELVLGTEPIDESGLVASRRAGPGTGAVVVFSGVVRGEEGGQPIAALEYEAFIEMAEHQFAGIFDAVERRWPVQSVRLQHRIGPVAAGKASLWLEVAAPHRAEAFEAAQFIVEELKRVVPIWKKPLRNFS